MPDARGKPRSGESRESWRPYVVVITTNYCRFNKPRRQSHRDRATLRERGREKILCEAVGTNGRVARDNRL